MTGPATGFEPDDRTARSGIHTRADLDLWLDGFEAGSATTLRTLADVPVDMLPTIVAAMNAERARRD